MKPPGNNLILMILMTVLLMTGACQSRQKGSRVIISDVENKSSTGGIESFRLIYNLYPSPAEMLSVIDMTEISFDESLLNPVERADQYVDSKSKEYALGIYLTDLAYTALFGRYQETVKYLEVAKSLTEETNISDAVDEPMIEKARNNVESLDSLYSISNDAYINILQYCEKNEKSDMLVILSAGAFIESLFLAVNMVDDYNAANQLIQHLANQKYSIDNFMRFAKSVGSDDPGVISTIKELEQIKMIFDGMESGTGKVSVKGSVNSDSTQLKKLTIGGADNDSQPHLSKKEFEVLKTEVIELRNSIAEGTL